MEFTDIFKALGNEYRWQILQWLKSPEQYFLPEQIRPSHVDFAGGICVGVITEKTGLAQSVVSAYLNTLKETGLIEAQRFGKWTYYRYNPQVSAQFLHHLHQVL